MAGDMTREERIQRFIEGLDELAVETQVVMVLDGECRLRNTAKVKCVRRFIETGN